MKIEQGMTPLEIRSSLSLASIYGLRMLGMFLILPIFAIYAEGLPGSPSAFQVGLALGAYGLTQALFQLPFGMLSDRYGRKNIIYIGLLLFALGSFVSGYSDDINIIILGRAIQGAGAISAAITALVADLTRDEHRTKAMAMIGATIGITFALSLMGAPVLNRLIGVPGIFMLTGFLSLSAILVVRFVVPTPLNINTSKTLKEPAPSFKSILKNKELSGLNFGIFALHAAQMAMFIVVPIALATSGGMDVNQHWKVYLPVLLSSFVFMVPIIILSEKFNRAKLVFISSIFLMLIAQLMFGILINVFWGLVASLFVYFVAFNVLEASLPSLISKIAPPSAKGTAIGVYNTCQSLGVFFGGLLGGFLADVGGSFSVFSFCAILMTLWVGFALSMKAPPAIKTLMFMIQNKSLLKSPKQLAVVQQQLKKIKGVRDVLILLEEGKVMLKVNKHEAIHEASIIRLLGGKHGVSE
ncbi:MFS transporter [Candidatus Methylopumilus universalis]|uniref:MFS transporter n=1 Tax=Candidatus Methylopumilus universalis TaxID=2588536 RepID=UPI001CB96B48|nr:MFS transporter [Candidatus Methylopumilus universalis]